MDQQIIIFRQTGGSVKENLKKKNSHKELQKKLSLSKKNHNESLQNTVLTDRPHCERRSLKETVTK